MSPARRTRARPIALVVDDDPLIRLPLRDALEDACEVHEAEDGAEALEAFGRLSPDIVLLDVMMPGGSGFETCVAIRRLPGGEHAPVLMMTGLDDVTSIQEAYRTGATDFVTKPMSYLVVAQRVQYMLRATRAMEDLRASEREIAALAYFDAPTRLPNRAFLLGHLGRLLDEHRPRGAALALLSIGVDKLKRFSDTLGHAAGERVLADVAARVVAVLLGGGAAEPGGRLDLRTELGRLTGTVARTGGDELAVILGDVVTSEDASVVARRLLDALAEPFTVAGNEIVVGVGVGIARSPADGEDAATLLKNAGSTMSSAKALGGNGLLWYDGSLDEGAHQRLTLERDLRQAIARDEIELHYQPQISAVTLEVVGVEALARWRHPERGLISPLVFIPIAEDTGLIVPLGERVLQIACAQVREWQDAGLPPLRVAVNVSAKQFRVPGMVAALQRVVAEARLAPELVELEITESALMDDAEAVDAALAALAAAGFRLALDDFGTGYSSLSYLKRFPFDALKVDRSFVRDLGNGPSEARLAAAIIAMAQALELDVVVEGVETEEQLRFVREHRCTEIQGFFFSPPLPATRLSEWVTAWHRALRSGDAADDARAVA
jgi:predicted signal transduction protein with EAL and GGDEF domain